jgi:hypothetical protein
LKRRTGRSNLRKLLFLLISSRGVVTDRESRARYLTHAEVGPARSGDCPTLQMKIG